jgi:hypothetical protein
MFVKNGKLWFVGLGKWMASSATVSAVCLFEVNPATGVFTLVQNASFNTVVDYWGYTHEVAGHTMLAYGADNSSIQTKFGLFRFNTATERFEDFCGAVLALVLTGIGIPALPFALGMFLPLQLNLPLLIGGLIAWFVSTRSKDQALNKARMSQGTLIASGFIAGGALMGVVGAILKFADVDWKLTQWNSSNAASWVGLGMYLALIIYFAVHSLRAKKEE